ncbi:hypothetical protein Fcan01_20486 [Folsomia candida]|uniref:Gustatory receptor n=2 Tax=Folsomia candida TaxID=158441 RepID=A0A226DJT8_FOLCA|nr:hypothetical protein Fcan01_20486 [Folsomia candida]
MQISNLTKIIPSLGPFLALQRFTILAEYLYHQQISWSRESWIPRPTKRRLLYKWYSLSFLLLVTAVILGYMGFGEFLISGQENMTMGSRVMLALFILGDVTGTGLIFSYVGKVDEICYIIASVQNLSGMIQRGSSTTRVGIVLHGFITGLIVFPMCVCFIPLLEYKMDPTYFWFRNITFLPYSAEILIRILIIFFVVLHGSVLIYSSSIYLIWAVLCFNDCLNNANLLGITNTADLKSVHDVFLRLKVVRRIAKVFTKFSSSLRKYRQLQIVTALVNNLLKNVILVLVGIMMIGSIVSGYILIKLRRQAPYSLIFFAVFTLTLIVVSIHLLFPLVIDATKKSNIFIRFWQLQNISDYRKKQLKSCRLLEFRVGSFHVVDGSSRANLMYVIVYYTVTFVISKD